MRLPGLVTVQGHTLLQVVVLGVLPLKPRLEITRCKKSREKKDRGPAMLLRGLRLRVSLVILTGNRNGRRVHVRACT